jgi:peroxiredoxin
MRNRRILSLIALAIILGSCKQKVELNHMVEEPDNIVRDLMSFLKYNDQNLKFSGDYVVLDSLNHPIKKDSFLKLYMSGHYLPVRLVSDQKTYIFKLIELRGLVDQDIKMTLQNQGEMAYAYHNMEGKDIPDFHFTSLDGRSFDNASTKGKILVLNTWFINCQSCVAEMPKLNSLVKKFKDRKDVLFLGLALDSSQKLSMFSKRTDFSYQIIPAQENYIQNILKLNMYPTHLIVGRNGKILKVTNENNAIEENIPR